jgi:hypothetical protein
MENESSTPNIGYGKPGKLGTSVSSMAIGVYCVQVRRYDI